MYRVVYFSGFVKTDLSVPERKLGESHGSPKILFMTIECSQSVHSIVSYENASYEIKTLRADRTAAEWKDAHSAQG